MDVTDEGLKKLQQIYSARLERASRERERCLTAISIIYGLSTLAAPLRSVFLQDNPNTFFDTPQPLTPIPQSTISKTSD